MASMSTPPAPALYLFDEKLSGPPTSAPKPSTGEEPSPPPQPLPPSPAAAAQAPGPCSFPAPASSKHWHPTKLVLMVLVPLLAVCALVGLLLWRWRKMHRSNNVQNVGLVDDDSESDGRHGGDAADDLERAVSGTGPSRYRYSKLAAATSNFAEQEKLGRGGFGSVYRGRLPGDDDGHQLVAIKKFLSGSSSQGRKEFEAEVKIISRLRHLNLVQLLGWCDSRKGLLLVYELVPGGSLDKHIHNTTRPLTWSERYKIILGLGSALRYLHQNLEQCVVHGDIKPSNIMLDSSYNAKLGDFGLARIVDHGAGWQTTKSVLGTAGYIDPELVNTRRPSTDSDIYSFGVVLLEIASGQPPVALPEGGGPPFVLLKWVWGLYSQNATLDAADERLRRPGDERQMERVLVVGLWCAHPDLGERPSIDRAMHVLQSDDERLPALSRQMYYKASPQNVADGGASGSSFSSGGVPTSATTGITPSSGSFVS